MTIFTFPRKPTANEDVNNIRKDIISGVTRDGRVTYFVRSVKKHTRYYDRCCDLVDEMARNDSYAARERKIAGAVRLLEEEGARVTWQKPASDKPVVQFPEQEGQASAAAAWDAKVDQDARHNAQRSERVEKQTERHVKNVDYLERRGYFG